jgi:outer membrane receptor for ferrienterochelin and colicin
MKSTPTKTLQYYFFSFFILIFISNISFGQSLTGKVTDKASNETLVGATVLIKEIGQSAFVQLDGFFKFKSIKPGTYNLVVTYIGYEKMFQTVTVNADGKSVVFIKMKSLTSELADVSVTSSRNSSEEKARAQERNADQLLNVVSSRAIELSPDITAGNVLQRVSGVSMERNGSGDGQYAIIRGLDKRYNYASINGIILPSPDVTERSVPLDMFPAELIQRIEVVKSLTPDMEADAIGGATNLVMKEGPSHLTINANLGTGLSTIFSGRPFSGFSTQGINFLSPTELYGPQYIAKVSDITKSQLNFHDVKYPMDLNSGLSIGDRLFHQHLGFMIGGSYNQEYTGGNRLFYQTLGANDNPPNSPAFQNVQNQQYSYLQNRLGLHALINFEVNPDHHFNLYGLFLQLDNNQHEASTVNGLGGTGEVDYFDRVIFDRKKLDHVSLTGHDKLIKNLVADWTLAYSKASSQTPDQLTLETYRETAETPLLKLSNLPSTWTHSDDRDKSGSLNLKYDIFSNVTITTGGLYRTKDRNGFYNYYLEDAGVAQPYTGINNAVFQFIPYPEAAMGVTTDENIYTANEQVSAVFIEGKILLVKKFQILAGVREETTDQSYASQISIYLPGKYGKFHYSDVLPGLHLRYLLNDKENLRLSYFAGISRPTLYDLIPSSINTNASNQYTSSGNYNLKHSTADNIDFRYDKTFSATDYFLVGAFYKRIVNAIEFSTFTRDGSPITANNPNVLYGPTNPAGDVINYGIELVGSKYIGKFGLGGNYSYTHSSVTTLKEILGNNQGSPVVTFVDQTRPLQGQADHIGNLSFLFKDVKSGLDAQLSYVYTGKRIAVVSTYYDLDIWQRASSQLDFSMNKELGHNLSFYFKATNLLNNKIYQDILHPNNLLNFPGGLPGQTALNRILVERDEFKQSLLLGLRYKLQ